MARVGGVGVMRQFIGSVRDATTVAEFLLGLAPAPLRSAHEAVERSELVLMERDDEASQMRYAEALAAWGDAGGYDAEVSWDTVTVAALGVPFERAKYREVATLSGGEQKRLALEALLRGPDEVLLLDEPDNYLDVPGKRWLEERLLASTQDGAVRQPRPRAAGQGGRTDRHRRRRHGLGARRWLRQLSPGPARAARADGR